jgi:hypothetical protein
MTDNPSPKDVQEAREWLAANGYANVSLSIHSKPGGVQLDGMSTPIDKILAAHAASRTSSLEERVKELERDNPQGTPIAYQCTNCGVVRWRQFEACVCGAATWQHPGTTWTQLQHLKEQLDDDEEWPSAPCFHCGGEGEVSFKVCAGNCDENGNHGVRPKPVTGRA